MSIDTWLAALLFVVLLWAARRIYSKGKAGTRGWRRGTLLFSIAISMLAYPAFQFVIVKRFVGSETGWLFDVWCSGLAAAGLDVNSVGERIVRTPHSLQRSYEVWSRGSAGAGR